jgi:hypothetical protein
VPIQEYFLNRRMNPEQFPEYVGVRITQEDARVYQNVLGCCERGCLDEVILAKVGGGASEGVGQESCESRAEGRDEIVGDDSGEDSGGEVSVDPELVSNIHPHNNPVNDVEGEEGSAEDAAGSGIWIVATAKSG